MEESWFPVEESWLYIEECWFYNKIGETVTPLVEQHQVEATGGAAKKPVVVYGTSILHGAAAGRAGMV